MKYRITVHWRILRRFIHFNLKKVKKMGFFKCLKVIRNTSLALSVYKIISTRKWKKFNEHRMHFVNLSFAATLFLYAILGLIFIRFHWYFVILLHEYTYVKCQWNLRIGTWHILWLSELCVFKVVECSILKISRWFTWKFNWIS